MNTQEIESYAACVELLGDNQDAILEVLATLNRTDKITVLDRAFERTQERIKSTGSPHWRPIFEGIEED